MWIRRAFLSWLFPAAVVLPLWLLLVGWGVVQAGGWLFLWVLFVAIPSVLVGEIVLSLLVRARPTVRQERAASWQDVLGFGLWHALTVVLGFFPKDAFGWLLTATIVAFLALFWSTVWQLWKDVKRGAKGFLVDAETTYAPAPGERERTAREGARRQGEVIVIAESGRADGERPEP